MAVVAKWYGPAMLGQFSGTAARRVDWANDTIKVALVKAAYVPNQDTDTYWSTPQAQECAGTNYTAGGKALAEKAASYDAASNTVRLKAQNVEWKEVTVEAAFAVIYKDTGVAGESPVLGYIDFGGTQKLSSGNLKIEWDATDGALRVVVS